MLSNFFSIDVIAVHKVDIQDVALDALHALSVSVGWPHRADDWRFLREHGKGFAAIDESGRVHATAMWFPFGEDFATIGMVITSQRLQAKGGGGWLMRHVLAQTEGLALGLHATRQSHYLYLTLGFKDEAIVHRYEGVAAPGPEVALSARCEVRALQASDALDILALDRDATGTDREQLLAPLIADSQGTVLWRDGTLQAYALQRKFGRGMMIGPTVAPSGGDAVAVVAPLIKALAGAHVRLDTGDCKGELTSYLSGCGLSVVDNVTRMSRGRPWPLAASQSAGVYGLTTHATG